MGIIENGLYRKYERWLLTTAEVAAELNISVDTLKRRVKAQKIVAPLEAKGKGGCYQWHLRDVAKYLGDTDS